MFYGFNYTNASSTASVRWGFGWNENGGGLYPNGEQTSNERFGRNRNSLDYSQLISIIQLEIRIRVVLPIQELIEVYRVEIIYR